jgi:hypothetical protein
MVHGRSLAPGTSSEWKATDDRGNGPILTLGRWSASNASPSGRNRIRHAAAARLDLSAPQTPREEFLSCRVLDRETQTFQCFDGAVLTTYDAFISYSTHDKTVADAACAALEVGCVRCWIAPRDITLGAECCEAIVQGIPACRVVVLIFGERERVPADPPGDRARRQQGRADHFIARQIVSGTYKALDAGSVEILGPLGPTVWRRS